MIDVKEAVGHAFEAIKEFYQTEKLIDLALEEVEFNEEENRWYITLGFKTASAQTEHPFAIALKDFKKYEAKYKIFEIDAETGKVLAMRIRQI